MSNEIPPVRIKAFVGRSFLEQDEALWYEFRKILESLRPIGLEFEDAKEAQLRPISEKVRQGIERNDFYIGILTRRLPIGDKAIELNLLNRLWISLLPSKQSSQWTTSSWVIQESGYALGKSKKVLLLIEQGVDFPTADLDADTEWIPFGRTAVSECSTRLVSMVGHLISEKLPTVPSAVQVASPQEPSSSEEPKATPAPASDFGRVIRLLNQGEFGQADEEFERFRSSLQDKPFDRWWNYFYLRLKSVRGHTASLDQLKTVVQTEPQNVEARIELAHYYSNFKDHNGAVQILTDRLEEVPEESKAGMLRVAAEELAKDKQQEKALKIIRDLMSHLTDSKELRLTYMTLAEVAKSQSDRELESAALERALDFDPSDSGLRFRLAYLYGEMQKRHLSTYHYNLRLAQGRDATALNNLGVAYGGLNLPGKQIEAFQRAGEDFWLAKANLSHAYVDGGFLAEAEKLASEVTRADCDETARNRAISALSRISTIRSTEKETEEKILTEAKSERIFRSNYAGAFLGSVTVPINGMFDTPHGQIFLNQEGELLLGEKEIEEQAPILPSLAALAGGLTNPSTRVKNKILKVEGRIIGRSGQFKIETRDKNAGSLLSLWATSSIIRGLLIIATDGDSFEVLDHHETGAKIYTATKISV